VGEVQASLADIVQFLLDKIDKLGDTTRDNTSTQDDLVKKNIVTGPGSTFEKQEKTQKVSTTLTTEEKRRLYLSGTEIARAFKDLDKNKKDDKFITTSSLPTDTVAKEPIKASSQEEESFVNKAPRFYFMGWQFAKAFHDFHQTKKIDTKEKNIIQRTKDKVSLPSIPTKKEEAGEKSSTSLLSSVLGGVIGTALTAWLAKSTIGKLITRQIGRVRRAIQRRTPRIVRRMTAKARGKAPLGKAPRARGIIGKATGKAGVVSKVATKTASALGIAGAAGKVAKVASVASKVAGPLAIAGLVVDAGISIKNLTTEAGRERLRNQAQDLDFRKNFWSTTGKVLFNPIQTITAAGVSISDYFKSKKNAEGAERRLKEAEETSRLKRQDILDKYDMDKSGDISVEERLARFKAENRIGFVYDGDQKYRYNPEDDTVASVDGKNAMSVGEFLKLQGKQIPEAEAPTPIPPDISPSPLAMPDIKDDGKPVVNVDLNDQNNLIVTQTRVMVEILNATREQLKVSRQPRGGESVTVNNVMSSPPSQSSPGVSQGVDARGLYLSSPYSLSPT
jgi:hypothetical protein